MNMELVMTKVGLFLLSNYRNSWQETGIIEELSKQSELTIFTSQIVANGLKSSDRIKVLVLPDVKSSRATSFLQKIALVNRRHLSSSFIFRMKRQIFGDLRITSSRFTKTQKLYAVLYNLRRLIVFSVKNHVVLLAYVPWIGRLLETMFRQLFLSKMQPFTESTHVELDVAIIPTAAIEDATFELVQRLKLTSIKTILCIENWDNLTSKSILIALPDRLMVMGDRCKTYGTEIQRVSGNSIWVAGLPRFNRYRELAKTYLEKHDEIFSILYLGCAVPHNEKDLLDQLQQRLGEKIPEGSFQIRYKPHPARQLRFFERRELPASVQVINSASNAVGFNAIPSINSEHMQVILDADLVIATPTSMALESMILRKKTIIDATDDGIHRTTAALSMKGYTHLRDLRSIKGLDFGTDIDSLVEKILSCYLEFHKHSSQPYDLSNLIELKAKSYTDHLAKLISE
jgi:hypothetical protein